MSYLYDQFKINVFEDNYDYDNNSSSLFDDSFENEKFENYCSNEIDEANSSDCPISKTNSIPDYTSKTSHKIESLTNCQTNIINIPKKNQEKVEKKKLGRKRKGSCDVGIHTEYSEDNLIRRAKKEFKDAVLELINSKIEKLEFKLYITNNNKKEQVKKLLNIDQKITKNASVEDNKSLFQSPIKNIFYGISKKYKKKSKNYNKAVIDELCTNEKCQEIGNILNLNYLDCLKFYRKDIVDTDGKLKCLTGLEEKFEQLPKNLKEEGRDKSYEEALIKKIKNIEKIYNDKTSRKKRKKEE